MQWNKGAALETAAPVVDFTAGYSASVWEPIWEDFYCDWRELWFNQRLEPPSWVVGDAVIAAGAKGILFPSRLAEGETNLLLFTQMLAAPDVLAHLATTVVAPSTPQNAQSAPLGVIHAP